MHTEWISIRNADGEYQAHLSIPPSGSGPGLVLFQEIFGVNEHIRQVAAQYRLDGFVVIAPDVFWREAPRIELGYQAGDVQRGKALKANLDDAQIRTDAASTLAALRARPELSGGIGVIGYCFGARIAYQVAACEDVDLAVCYYGTGTEQYLDLAPQIDCPTLFHFGGRDASIPEDAIERIHRTFTDKPGEVCVHPDAGHGFNCWARSSYHQPSALAAHGRTLDWMSRTLASSG